MKKEVSAMGAVTILGGFVCSLIQPSLIFITVIGMVICAVSGLSH